MKLTTQQIAQFKRDGYLVLPAALDAERCRQARDDMWRTIGEYLPRMKRQDPSTWGHITDAESESFEASRPAAGGDPYFGGKGHRFYIRNGTEESMLDLAPRAMWPVAEQLLGAGSIVEPAGMDASGTTVGPCFMSDDAVGGLASHLRDTLGQPEKGSFTTVPALRLPPTGPVWLTGQGTRGLYCTLPGSPDPGPEFRGSHSDGACYGRWRVQMAAYIDDLPPRSGGFTVWPGSHTRIWQEQWQAFFDGEKHTDKHLEVRRAGGYTDPEINAIRADTQPVDCHGPAGTVVLWHTKILHMAGHNQSTDVLRQATIYGYLKTPEAVPDDRVVDEGNLDIWRDWSDEVRAIDA